MLKCVNYWIFKGGMEQTKPLEEAFKETKEAGFRGIELSVGETGVLNMDSDKDYCQNIVDLMGKHDIKVKTVATILLWNYTLTDNDENIRRKGISLTKKMIKIASWLGAESILMFPGAVDVFFRDDYTRVPYDVCYKRSIRSMEEIIPIAEELNINLCIENVANKFLYSPYEMKDYIDSFKSEKVCSYLDVGNLLYTGGYPEDWIRILGNRIKAVHFKDYSFKTGGLEGFCELLKGDVNWSAVIKELNNIEYKGPATAEIMPPSEGLLVRTSEAMDKINNLNY